MLKGQDLTFISGVWCWSTIRLGIHGTSKIFCVGDIIYIASELKRPIGQPQYLYFFLLILLFNFNTQVAI